MKTTPTTPDALTVVPGREVTYHESSPASGERASADRLKSFLARQHDPRRDIVVANAVLDVLRASSLTEAEAIDVAKRIMSVLAERTSR
jgi:hypothetical protein